MISEHKPARRLAWGVALFVFIAIGVITVRRAATPALSTDFTAYLVAAEDVWKGGRSLYTVSDARGLHYIYPPFFAVLMAPLALLPVAVASGAWYVISVALLVVALRSTVRLVAPEGKPAPFHLLWPAILICADPLLGTLSRGQLGILMFACSVGALSLHRQGHSFQAGLIVAFATIIKMYTGLLGLYFLVRRDWRAVWGGLAGGVVFGFVIPAIGLGPAQALIAWREWIEAVILPFSRPGGTDTPLYRELHNLQFARNQSLVATLTHVSDLFTGMQSAVEPDWVRFVMRVGAVLVVIALAIVWRRDVRSSYEPLFKWSLAVMWGMLLVPVAWTHYFVMLILPLTAVVGYLMREPHDRVWRTLRAALIAIAVLASVYTLSSILQGPMTGLGMRAIVMIPRSIGLYCASALILSGAFLYVLLGNARKGFRDSELQSSTAGGNR